MASSSLKVYRIEGLGAREELELYFSDKPDLVFEEDFLIFPIENFKNAFKPGRQGDVLIDISIGSMFSQGISLNTRTGDMQGESDQLPDKEEKVTLDVQNVKKEKMMDLPPADYVTSAWLLNIISKNQDDCIKNVRMFSKLLKPGGCLILIGLLDMTYYTVGKDKVRAFTHDKDFIKKALVGEGFAIDNCVVKERTAVSDLILYKDVIFIEAHKLKV